MGRPNRSTTIGRCPARAAIAGNPSDGYGGFVVAVPVRSVGAQVSATPAARFELTHSPTADDTFDTLSDLVDHVDRYGVLDARALVLATLRALVRRHTAELAPVRLDVVTDIPRSVGLAGSTAIVIATVRALAAQHSDTTWSGDLMGEPTALAEFALSVETDELGLTAGIQDRLVLAHDAPLAMDFSSGHHRALDRVPARCFVAYRTDAAEISDRVHRSLRDDHDDDVGDTRDLLDAIAAAGREAAEAIDRSDVDALGVAVDRTLALRSELVELHPAMIAVARTIRDHGGHANWTGSGGAVIAVLGPAVDTDALIHALRVIHRCEILPVEE